MRLNLYIPLKRVKSAHFGDVRSMLSKIFFRPDSSFTLCETAPKIPLIIILFACATIPRYKEEIQTIEQTWGHTARALGIPVFYFLGEEQTDLQGPQYIYLNGVKNDYQSASYKQFLGYQYILRQYNPDTIFCAGTDTFINIPKLQQLVSVINPESAFLVGNSGTLKEIGSFIGDYFSGGCGLLTTRETHRRIIGFTPFIVDQWINICNEFRSDLSPACDVALSFLCHYCSVQFLQCMNMYEFSYNSCDPIQGTVNQSELISCHSMSKDDFFTFNTILETNNHFKTP
jgi:hypothetical protein